MGLGRGPTRLVTILLGFFRGMSQSVGKGS